MKKITSIAMTCLGIAIFLGIFLLLFGDHAEEFISSGRRSKSLVNTFGLDAVLWFYRLVFIFITVGLAWAVYVGRKADRRIDRMLSQRDQLDNSIRREK